MKTLLTIIALAVSMMASGQSVNDSIRGVGRLPSLLIERYATTMGKDSIWEPKFPVYDTSHKVVVHFDTANVVKADSCLVVRRADEYCRTDCPDGRRGCLVYHAAPCWYEYRIILHSGEIIDPKRKISLH